MRETHKYFKLTSVYTSKTEIKTACTFLQYFLILKIKTATQNATLPLENPPTDSKRENNVMAVWTSPLTLSNANYDAAIEILKDRFGQPQQILSAHMDQIFKIQT